MRTPFLEGPPAADVSSGLKLALGATLGLTGGAIVVLSMLYGWTGLTRPWNFLIGLAGGLTGGVGAAMSVCGLIGLRMTRARGEASGDVHSV